jgi:hypothetical protein
MDPWMLDKVKKGEERWGRFKLALNQVNITDVDAFANRLK